MVRWWEGLGNRAFYLLPFFSLPSDFPKLCCFYSWSWQHIDNSLWYYYANIILSLYSSPFCSIVSYNFPIFHQRLSFSNLLLYGTIVWSFSQCSNFIIQYSTVLYLLLLAYFHWFAFNIFTTLSYNIFWYIVISLRLMYDLTFYRLVNDSNFGWRGLRLLACRSPHFFTHSTSPIATLPDYLTTMIRKLAKDLPVCNQFVDNIFIFMVILD